MNVRIDYQPAPLSGSGRRPRGTWARVLALTLGAALLLLPAALFLVPRDDSASGDRKPSGAPSATASAPAMPRGEATAAARLATRSVSGLPRGFPRTEAGAVEAGASFASATHLLQRMAAPDRTAYARDAMLRPPPAAELDAAAAAFRARHGLTAAGQPHDKAGRAPAATRFTSRCHPALGAYRVAAYAPDRATVDYWMPCLLGTVHDDGTPARVRTQWQMGRMDLHWHAGDWRVGDLSPGPFTTPVTPDDPGEPATTTAERAALLGDGWLAFADADDARPDEAPR
jgi:hypothetical protein